jgi:hypothetical protein
MAGEEKVKFLNFCALQGRKRELLLYHAQESAHNQLTIDTTMKTLTWNNANGQEIKITVSLVSSMVDFDITVAGNNIGQVIGGIKPVIGHPTVTASLGKLALNAERAEQVKQAIAAVEATRKASGRSTREIAMDNFDSQGYELARRMVAQA